MPSYDYKDLQTTPESEQAIMNSVAAPSPNKSNSYDYKDLNIDPKTGNAMTLEEMAESSKPSENPILKNYLDPIVSEQIGMAQGAIPLYRRLANIGLNNVTDTINNGLKTLPSGFPAANMKVPSMQIPDPNPYLSQISAVKNNPGFNTVGQIAGNIAGGVPLAELAGIGSATTVLSRLGQQAGFGGITNGIMNGFTPENVGEGAALGLIPAAGIEGVNSIVRKMAGSNVIPVAKQAFNNALDRLGLTNDVPSSYKTGDAAAQADFENNLIHTPTGRTIGENIFNKLDNHANNIQSKFDLRDVSGQPIEHAIDENGLKQNIQQKIDNQYKDNLFQHQQNYVNFSKSADETGQTVPLTPYENYLRGIVDDYHNPQKRLGGGQPSAEVYNFAKDKLDALEELNYSNKYVRKPSPNSSVGPINPVSADVYKNPGEKRPRLLIPSRGYEGLSGGPSNISRFNGNENYLRGPRDTKDNPSYSFVTGLEPEINHAIYKNYNNPDVKNFYLGAKKALNQSLQDATDQSKNIELQQQWKQAKQYYEQNVAPFVKQKGIKDLVSNFNNMNPNPDKVVSSLIKTGKAGNATDLNQTLSLVPSIKDDLGYLNLKQGTVGDEPKSAIQNMMKNIRPLSNDTAAALYSPQVLQHIKDLNEAYQGFGSLKNNMVNANTGGKKGGTLSALKEYGPYGFGALAGLAGLSSHPYFAGSAAGGLAAALAAKGGKRLLDNFQTQVQMKPLGSKLEIPKSVAKYLTLGGLGLSNLINQ